MLKKTIISHLNEIFVAFISILISCFNFYPAKYWKGKIRRLLNDIFVVLISFLFFLI